MPALNVNVANKIATGDNAVVVCGNSDYIINFTFDEEWDSSDLISKTAYFVFGPGNTTITTIFNGTTCAVPVMSNINGFKVGLSQGNLHTTTPAWFDCVPSILCSATTPTEPTEEVYDQIMEQLDDIEQSFAETLATIDETVDTALQEAKDSGEFDGPQGPIGPTGETGPQGAAGPAGESGVYIGTDEPTDPDINVWINQNGDADPILRYDAMDLTLAEQEQARDNIGASPIHNSANALKKTIAGNALRADDVSPLAHNLSVIQYGQCVQDGTPTPAAPIPITGKVAGGEVGDGTATTTTQTVTDANGDPVTLYGVPVASGGNVTIDGQQYIADSIEGNAVSRKIGSIDMGAMTYTRFQTGGRFYSADLINNIARPQTVHATGACVCENYVTDTYNNTVGSFADKTIAIATDGKIWICDTSYTDAISLKDSLSGVMLYYELATPTTEIVTISPAALEANSPTTTWLSDAYSEVEYNCDINKVVKTKGNYELIEEITLTEEAVQFLREQDLNGRAYDFAKMMVAMTIPSGSGYSSAMFYNGATELGYTYAARNATYPSHFKFVCYQMRGYWQTELYVTANLQTNLVVYAGNKYLRVDTMSIGDYPSVTKFKLTSLPTGTTIRIFGEWR